MKTTQHTPAPWHYSKGYAPHYQGQVYHENTGRTIALVYNDEDGADARLIAAAPELLELAHQIVLECENSRINQIPDDIYQGAVRAIAKAKGETK
jgi:hypothetical protein